MVKLNIPLQTHLPKTYSIAKVMRETATVTTLTFDVSLGARPGQFLMLWVPGVNEIPMSIALDDGKKLEVTFFAVGNTTKKLAEFKKGDLVGLRGPFGTFYEWEKGERLALVAGGYGAAPMYFAAKEAAKTGCNIDVFLGARSKNHLLYLDKFGALKKTRLHVSTNDGTMGFSGHNVELLRREIIRKKNGKISRIFACGPERMLFAVSELAYSRKIPAQLSLERYMKCGYGLCGNCVVDPLGVRLCTDGPVVKNEICRKIAEFGRYHRDSLGRKRAI